MKHDAGIEPMLNVYPDLPALARAVASEVAELARAAIQGKGRFTVALAGGNTPRSLYALLAREYAEQISWSAVHLFWGDERYVPPEDPRSNYKMAWEALLHQVLIPPQNIHPMPTDFPVPEDAARAYEKTLKEHFPAPWPEFDLVLLGLGPDGHTASLFPGTSALAEGKKWVVAVRAPVEPPVRLSLTFPVLNHASHIFFLVSGSEKAEAVRRALTAPPDPITCPASAVRPLRGAARWWLDQRAAAYVSPSKAHGTESP